MLPWWPWVSHQCLEDAEARVQLCRDSFVTESSTSVRQSHDGAAHTVSTLCLSRKVVHFLSVGGGLNWILWSSTGFAAIERQHCLWRPECKLLGSQLWGYLFFNHLKKKKKKPSIIRSVWSSLLLHAGARWRGQSGLGSTVTEREHWIDCFVLFFSLHGRLSSEFYVQRPVADISLKQPPLSPLTHLQVTGGQ